MTFGNRFNFFCLLLQDGVVLSDPINHQAVNGMYPFGNHYLLQLHGGYRSPWNPYHLLYFLGQVCWQRGSLLYPLFFFSVRNSERIIIKMRLLTVSNRKCAFTFCKRIFCIKKFNSVFGNRSMNCYELSRFIIKFRFVSHICYQGNVVVRLSQKLLLSTFFCINRVGNKHNFSFSNRDPIRCKRHNEGIIRKDGGDSFPPPPGFDGEPSPRRMRSPKG